MASYLGRSDKTVRRWEEKEGLPIHRLHHDKRGSVYAYKHELDSWWQLRKETLDTGVDTPDPPAPLQLPRNRSRAFWLIPVILLAAVLCLDVWLRWHRQPTPGRIVRFSRITDFVGQEEAPAISPDGKIVAFVARSGRRRHIWIRLLAGGAPVQITHDDVDHEQPRWTPDAASLIYYSPSSVPGELGTISEIPALGGLPRRIASAFGGGDCSHDGRFVALFHSENKVTELVAVERQGSNVRRIARVDGEELNEYPRWSPDDHWIGFQSNNGARFEARINVVPAAGGEVRVLARGEDLRGLTWSGDGSALVYSSSADSTILYPPIFNLRIVGIRDDTTRQLTFGEVSYLEPDLRAGRITVSRVRMQSNIWRFPVLGTAEKNTRDGVRLTNQTGQVQTPSVSPSGQEMVYLSDSGGHGNLWISKTDGSETRQLTFERDPTVAVGVPTWSPAGDYIAFVVTHLGQTAQWIIHPDGSGMRQLVAAGVTSYWSADGRWLYYVVRREGVHAIEKVAIAGGAPVLVRSDDAVTPTAADGSVLYFATFLHGGYGTWDLEFRRARPEDGPSEILTRISAERVPHEAPYFQMILSPDRKWLATPLTDSTTTNLWLLPAEGGSMRQITDFGDRSIQVVRRVSWSPDSKQLYASVADSDADILLLDGLIPTPDLASREQPEAR